MKTDCRSKVYVAVAMVICLAMLSVVFASESFGATTPKGKKFTIKPSTCPVNPKMKKYRYYNKYTRQYYTIRSYMELLEKRGGGQLKLKKGKYSITNTIFVPSNVTIVLENGVVINKGKKTHVKGLKASKSLFHFIKPSKGQKKNVYGKYNSSKNIKMIGKGKAVIDMKYEKNGNCIEAGHNANVTIKGITFQNVSGGHFIEMDANKNARVENCTFKNIKDSKNVREAINLDTPDKITGGFTAKWSKMDCTPNQGVVIKKCTFKNMPRALGTHNYSGDFTHKSITVIGNKISGVSSFGIGIMNWEGFSVTGNTIVGKIGPMDVTGSDKHKETYDGVLGYGSSGGTISGNTIKNFRYPILFKDYQDQNHPQYEPIYVNLTEGEMDSFMNNSAENVKFEYAFIQKNLTIEIDDYGNEYHPSYKRMLNSVN